MSPEIHFGKSHVARTRITVQNVPELVDEGIPFDRIIHDLYPDLKVEDIHACMRYTIAVAHAGGIPRTARDRPGKQRKPSLARRSHRS